MVLGVCLPIDVRGQSSPRHSLDDDVNYDGYTDGFQEYRGKSRRTYLQSAGFDSLEEDPSLHYSNQQVHSGNDMRGPALRWTGAFDSNWSSPFCLEWKKEGIYTRLSKNEAVYSGVVLFPKLSVEM